MWVVGKILEPLKPLKNGMMGPDPTKEEFDEFKRDLMNSPVYIEHDFKKLIGVVTDVFIKKDGTVFSTLYIDEKLALRYNIMHDMFYGNSGGLSFGQFSCMCLETGIRTSKMIPLDVSIVSQGGVKDSRIIAYGNNDLTFISKSGINKVFPQIKRKSHIMEKHSTEDIIKDNEKNISNGNKRAKSIIDDLDEKELEAIFNDAKLYRELESSSKKDLENQIKEKISKLVTFTKENNISLKNDTFDKLMEQSLYDLTNNSKNPMTPLYVSASITEAYSDLKQKYETTVKELEKIKQEVPEEFPTRDKNKRMATEGNNKNSVLDQLVKTQTREKGALPGPYIHPPLKESDLYLKMTENLMQ